MLVTLLLLLNLASANSTYQRYQARSSDRWTIANWFETKRQISLMDQWLLKNRKPKNIFDLELSAAHQAVDTKQLDFSGSESESRSEFIGGHAAIYIYFLGIEGEYFENTDDSSERKYSMSMHLRLLGTSNQTTRWIVFYGKYFDETNLEAWRPTFYGTQLTVYITDFLGIEGSYRNYLEEPNDLSHTGDGFKQDFSVFIDIYFLRLYGTWSNEEIEFKNDLDQKKEIENKSFEAGLKFFF